MRGVIVDTTSYDWEGDEPLGRPIEESVIYEMHVARLHRARRPRASQHPGTFAGLVEKIPYLKELGVTAVELLPVFDVRRERGAAHEPGRRHAAAQLLGLQHVSALRAAGRATACSRSEGGHVDEFRDMVKALHRPGIEVILDVVFNHTDEGNHQGPTISFKGLDNETYYMLVPGDRAVLHELLRLRQHGQLQPPGRREVHRRLPRATGSSEMHVDGFRFDEGSVLARGADGAPMQFPPVVWRIELSEDAAPTPRSSPSRGTPPGSTRSATSPASAGAEWNGTLPRRRAALRPRRLRRSSARSRRASPAAPTSTRPRGRLPTQQRQLRHLPRRVHAQRPRLATTTSTTRPTARATATATTTTSSWNCGVEGADRRPGDRGAARAAQVKNFATILMRLAGRADDRRGRRGAAARSAATTTPTARTTSSAGSTGTLAERHADVFRFFKELIAFRKRHPSLHRRALLHRRDQRRAACRTSPGTASTLDRARLGRPARARRWPSPLGGLRADEPDLHVMMNMYWRAARLRAAPDRRARTLARGSPTPRCPRPTTSPSRRTGAGRYRRRTYWVAGPRAS